jgi:putative peptidoglycan lipid II flippase
VSDVPADERAGLIRSSAAVAAGTLTSRVTGLLRIGALAWAVGGGTVADVYNLSNSTPNFVYELIVGGILAATIVPIFVRQFADGDERSTSAVFTITMTVVAVFTFVAMLCTPLLARLYTISADTGDAADQRRIITVLLLCFLPQMLFYALTALETALLNARRRFVAAAFAPALSNVVIIGTMLVFGGRTHGDIAINTATLRDDIGLVLLLGLGTTLGIATMALVLIAPVRRAGVRIRPVFAWRDAGVRTLVRLSGWTLGYVAANQLTQIFVLVLAKTGDPGNVTAYSFAFIFYVLPHSLIAVSIMTTMSPELARRAADDDLPGLRRDFTMGLRYLALLLIPASVLFLTLAQPIVGSLQIGEFNAANAAVTGDTLQIFAISLVPMSLYLYTMRAFYARQDTRTPFFINLAENAVNFALAIALFPTYGVQGLAWSWVVAYFVGAVIALGALRRQVGPIGDVRLRHATVAALLGSAALAAVTIPLAGAIGTGSAAEAVAATLAASLAGGAAYVGVLALLRSDDLATITSLVRRRRVSSADVSP